MEGRPGAHVKALRHRCREGARRGGVGEADLIAVAVGDRGDPGFALAEGAPAPRPDSGAGPDWCTGCGISGIAKETPGYQ